MAHRMHSCAWVTVFSMLLPRAMKESTAASLVTLARRGAMRMSWWCKSLLEASPRAGAMLGRDESAGSDPIPYEEQVLSA